MNSTFDHRNGSTQPRRACPQLHPDTDPQDRREVLRLVERGLVLEAFDAAREAEDRRLRATRLSNTDTASVITEKRIIRGLLNSNDPKRRERGRQRAAELKRNRKKLIAADHELCIAQQKREFEEDRAAEAERQERRKRALKGIQKRRAGQGVIPLFVVPENASAGQSGGKAA